MNSEVTRKVRNLLIVVLGAVVLFVGAFFVYNALVFRIVNTNPAVKKINVVSPFFKINFNQPLGQSIHVSSVPDVVSSYKVEGKTLNITLKIPMDSTQVYVILVSNIQSNKGKKLPDHSFRFQPLFVSSDQVPKDQGQVLLNNQSQYGQTIQNNSLIQLLPFTGPNFEYQVNYTVNYTNDGPVPVIQITAPAGQAQQDALSWIKAQGQDPSKLQIQYINAQP